MPRRSAAWMTVTPSSTSIVWSSISILGMGSQRRRLGAEGAAAKGGVLLELRTELRREGPGRHGRTVGQGADGVALDVVGHVEEEVDVPGRRAADLEAAQHAGEPPGALAARRALPARLVVEERDHVVQRPHHAG